MVTLEGFLAGLKGETDWFLWNDEIAKSAIELMGAVDMMLFGRVTYDLMASYWPTAKPPEEDPTIIEKMNKSAKIVFSNTLQKAEWNNTRIIKTVSTEEIQKLKSQPGKNLVIYGSGTIVSELLNLGLLDEMYIMVCPVILGEGKPLFKDIRQRHKLKHMETKMFSNGVVMLRYQAIP